MVVLRRDSRSKRVKGRYEKPAPDRNSTQADLVALIRGRRKAAAGSEQRAAGGSCLRSSVPGMPAGSEGKSGDSGRRACPGLNRIERFEPEGKKAPTGSGDAKRNRECRIAFRQRVCAMKPPAAGSKPWQAGEQKVSGPEDDSAGFRSSRSESSTSEWWFGERTVVPSE